MSNKPIEKAVLEVVEPKAANLDENGKKIYRGNVVTISDLVGKGVTPVQHVLEEEKRADKLANGVSLKMPRLSLIEKIDKGFSPTVSQVTYRTEGTLSRRSIYVPSDLRIRALNGKVAERMHQKYKEFMSENIGQSVAPMAFTIGADPEIFVENAKGELIPAFMFLKSKTDKNVDKTSNTAQGNKSVYWDGFQAEFETSAPTCLAWLTDSIHLGLRKTLELAKKVDKNAKLSSKTVVEISENWMKNAKPEHLAFGCNPSYNIYGLSGKEEPGNQVNWRFAGGHQHYGIGKQNQKDIEEIVKSLDAILGVACVSAFEEFDSPIRRQYYGLPGEYRLPPHGLEYRTLSNAWLCHPLMCHLTFDLGRQAIKFGKAGLRPNFNASEKEIIETILYSDVEKAREIMNRNKKLIVSLLRNVYPGTAEKAFDVFYGGMHKFIKNPHDLTTNWNLQGTWVTHSDGAGKCWNKAVQTISTGGKV